MRSMGASASAVLAPALAPEVPVRGWVFGFPVSGLGPAGLGQHASHDWCCACCHGQLPSPFPSSGPSILPICPLCLASDVPPSRVRQAAMWNPYVPSGEPVHIMFTFSVPAERPLCKSVAGRLGTRALPWLRFDDCSGAVKRFSFPSPNPCAFPSLEGPNPNLQFSGQPCQATAEGSQLGPFTDTCVACGCEPCCPQFLAEFSILSPIPCPSLHSEGPNPFLPCQPCLTTLPALDPPQESCCLSCGSYRPLGFQPDAAVQQFLDACCKVVALRPSEALRRVLRDALEYCPYCLLQWDSNFNSHKVCREVPSCSVSGPSYFPLSFDSGVVDVEPDCSSVSLFCSAESAAIRSVSRDRCTPVFSVSRRTRRRRNRRLRLVGQLSSCDDSSSGEVSAFPYVHRGTENEHRLPSHDSLIEPLGPAQGAPKTPEEEVLSRRWAFCQEVVGRWPGGLGGPRCDLALLQSLVAPSCAPCNSCSQPCEVDADVPAESDFQPDVRPVGCTRGKVNNDSVADASPAAVVSPTCAKDCWSFLLQSLCNNEHAQVLEAVEVLENQGHMHENTFAWRAAELAVEAGDGVPWHVAISAVKDVFANLNAHPDGRTLFFISANVTKWRKDLASWLGQHRPDLWLVQETHIKEVQGDLVATHVGPFGYRAFSLPGVPTGAGGNSGGLAIVFKSHLDVRKSHHFLHQGAGFQAVVLRIKGVDLFLVNLYLRSDEGFRGPVNALILSHLIPYLRSLNGEFIVAGDFNEDISVMVTTCIDQEVRGSWLHSGGSTCAGGGNIDYGLLSKGISVGASLWVDWVTPFAPHAALHWTITRQHCDFLIPQLAGFKPCPLKPQPFVLPAPGCGLSQPTCESEPDHHCGSSLQQPALSERFQVLSGSVEFSVFGCVQGRGGLPKFTRAKMLRQAAPAGAWGGARASFWKRVLVWLERCGVKLCPSPFGSRLHRLIGDMWSGQQQQLCEVQSQFEAFCREGDLSVRSQLSDVAALQFRVHSMEWMQQKSASYLKWLRQASAKGSRGLFKSVKAEEAVHLRPFLDHPLQDRIYLRWRQWFDLWSDPQGVDHELLNELKCRAMLQARELGPIPVDQAIAAFKRVPTKAPGLDGWTCEVLRNLQAPAVEAIVAFLHHCELEATWPDQMVYALIALLPKSEKRERPIALLHVLYRTWVRMRWKLVSEWQIRYSSAAVWDKAMPGSQVLDVALGRLIRGEATRMQGHHLITVFIDMETFYDRCRFNDVIASGFSLSYPPLILHQALLTYMGPRFLQSEGSVCPAIIPFRGVLAGCPAAPSISKLVVHPVAATVQSKRATSNLDVWIDDMSLDSVHASARQVAADAILLFRSLRSALEARGAKLSLEKTSFVASSSQAAKCLWAIREDTDPQVRAFARDLGVTSGGARRRLLGLAEQRRCKARGRASKLAKLTSVHSAHEIRVMRASICAAGLWGHQAAGVSPKRRKWYRTLCAKAIGRHKLGSLDISFLLMSHKCEDPHLSILRQHLRAVSRVFYRWQVADPDKFSSAWVSLWLRLLEVPHPWKRVTGPLSATLAYLIELGVEAASPSCWKHGLSTLHVQWDCLDACRKVWQWVYPIWEQVRNNRVASLAGCSCLEHGIDSKVPRRLMQRRFFNKQKHVHLQALWQGALFSESKPGLCSLCNCALDLNHVLWQCPFINSKFPEPPHLTKARALFPWPSLWLRGLVPSEATRVQCADKDKGLLVEGLWSHQQTLPGNRYFFASDASGGPGAKDSRALCVSWAIGAYLLHNGLPERVASLTCLPKEPLSVAQAEQRALFELFSRVEGDFDVTVDCQGVVQVLRRASPPKEGPVPWGLIWNERRRASAVWVPSHKDSAYFNARGLPEWRRLLNSDVDSLCGDRSSVAYARAFRPDVASIDQICEDVCLHLSKKIGHILRNKAASHFPWVLQRGASDSAEEAPRRSFVRPAQCFDKHATEAPASPNKKQLLLQLVNDSTRLGHQWVPKVTGATTTNFAVQCQRCQLYIEQCHSQPIFMRKFNHPCEDIEAPLQQCWEVHSSHVMVNKGAFFACSKCLAMVKIAAKASTKALQAACKGVSRKTAASLRTPTHAKVEAKQSRSLEETLLRPSSNEESQPGLPGMPPGPRTGRAKPKAKTSSGKSLQKSRPPDPKQKLLSFGK